MKKLNINSAGRMPLWQKDLEFIQQAFTEPIMALIAELAKTNTYRFPVSGCEVTFDADARTVSMSAGWFWWDGELLPVHALPATSLETTAHGAGVHLSRIGYNPVEGARNFVHADLTAETIEDVWQDDYLQPEACLRNASYTSGVTICPGAWTLHDRLRLAIAGGESEWLGTQSEIQYDNVQYKCVGQMVVLKGTVHVRDGSAMPSVQGLPVPMGGTAYLTNNEITHGATVTVNDRGWLHCTAIVDGLTSYRVDGMMYMAASPYIPPIDMNVIFHE